MLITLTTTERPATDLGFLLHKHPARAQSFSMAAGTAHVFYPRADTDECTAALLLEVDPIGLVRGRRPGDFALGQYVNDRPYAAGSMLAVALASVFRTAMAGRCDSHPELAARPIPLRVEIPAVPGDADLVRRLFEPLGWTVDATPIPLDPAFPDWGDSRYVTLTLSATVRLADALKHLYVLLPVLDNTKHYWVGEDEVTKLLRAGEGWLATHPARQLISERYLAHQRVYVRSALDRLAETDAEEDTTPPRPLAARRREAVLAVLRSAGAHRVLDLGCGDGALLRDLPAEPSSTEIVGVDVSAGTLAKSRAAPGSPRSPVRVTPPPGEPGGFSLGRRSGFAQDQPGPVCNVERVAARSTLYRLLPSTAQVSSIPYRVKATVPLSGFDGRGRNSHRGRPPWPISTATR